MRKSVQHVPKSEQQNGFSNSSFIAQNDSSNFADFDFSNPLHPYSQREILLKQGLNLTGGLSPESDCKDGGYYLVEISKVQKTKLYITAYDIYQQGSTQKSTYPSESISLGKAKPCEKPKKLNLKYIGKFPLLPTLQLLNPPVFNDVGLVQEFFFGNRHSRQWFDLDRLSRLLRIDRSQAKVYLVSENS